ncbi:MAG: Gfo/Idh/MocA family oxidoreductase [Planctomycetaceae bacterium]|jgi:predicted dehydrogenase|nr:Gfo/Idh/MocA family oxidoreductase [Planctomycetaceae bacterium]MBT6155660.1 Gfo/Idh/MocA family oxidoreductase [Planctomycetaceae bacterium]MBT6486296.1 Gfo/Idh/MocA family oxidoreductase [Planctomycetaceae bacterium]MBT6494277.1 Gfo/Idh/MocA family oxidoreductase [Planctomycetaceae bacterium]
MSHQTTRRDFVKQSAALGTAWWVGSQSAFALSKSPLEKINFACIGVDGKGSSDSNSAGGAGNIVALCDIDDNRMARKAAAYKDAKKYNDYRVMLDEMGDKIDAVTVSTPDHSHAAASMLAMKKGKHCFTQKPLTWSLYEARVLRETAAKMKVCTQMGNQGTAENRLRTDVEIVRSGAIGNVTEIHIWTNRPVWPQGTGRPKGSDPIPKNLHWDLFLGPAGERPYVAGVYHPFKWRGWIDFGTGALGDMACHTMNMPVMALDLFDPISVVADTSGIVENESYPKYSVITYQFPARGKLPACKMIWYDGGKRPPESLGLGEVKLPGRGSVLVGDKGTLISHGDYSGQKTDLLPGKKFADFENPEQTLPRATGSDAHFREFAQAILANEPTKALSNFDHAGRLTETVLLGNLSLRGGGKLIEWDAKNLKATNFKDQDKLAIKREYREGWTL